jgi:phosphatidylserine/phosphatidylglycerophosphate/cardiolipin synthase-like enzyme
MRSHRLILLFLAAAVLLAYLLAPDGTITAENPAGALCPPLEGELYNELWPNSGSLPDEDGRWAVSNGTWTVTPGQVAQQNTAPGQLNVAYEITTDIADGIIYGCMQIPDLPPGNAEFPHGFVFRTDGATNGYGVGFINHNTLALGRMVNGTPVALQVVTGNYDAEALNRFKIVIDRATTTTAGRIRVYVAQGNDPFPPVADLGYATSHLDNDTFRAGKVGLGTYGVAAVFGSLHVDFDCSQFTSTNNLSPIGLAVYTSLIAFDDHRTFCGNRYEEIIQLPSVEGDPNHDPNHPHQSAFIRYADLIATAKQEVVFTTMLWDTPLETTDPEEGPLSAGPLALLGYDPATGEQPSEPNGLEKLRNHVLTSPQNYPDGVTVRILLGMRGYPQQDQRERVLQTLKQAGISLCEDFSGPPSECDLWRVEVAYYKPIGFDHSHVKSLVVDRNQAIVSGYNVNNWYSDGTYDLGVRVSGPAAFSVARKFQQLWQEAQAAGKKGKCKPGEDDILVIEISQCQTFVPGPAGILEGEYAPPLTAIKLLDVSDSIFTLYRDRHNKAADNAIGDGLRAATNHINVWQERMTLANFGMSGTLPFMNALADVIESNANANNEAFRVRLMLQYFEGPQRVANRRGVRKLRQMIGEPLWPHLEVKLFGAGPPRLKSHTKALSIDGQFLIIGSQNWDFSAWGSGGLNELNYGIDHTPVTHLFDDGIFLPHWNDRAQPPCEVYPGENWRDNLAGCNGETTAASGQQAETIPIVWLDEGIYAGSNLVLDQPVDIIGLGPETILEPEPGTPAGEPLVRITASDVSLVGLTFRNSTGYAIEIGDGVTPVANVFIGLSVFENNAYGGIKINGPASVYYVENNTFAGGEAGIVVNVSGTASSSGTARPQTIVRNNIFSGQTTAPVVVASPNDGGVSYSYNLFDNCIRAQNGVCPENWLIGDMHANSIEHHNLVNTPPNFSDPGSGDYSLVYPSAAIDAGDPKTTSLLDADGIGDGIVRADMGAIPFVPDPELWQLVPTAPEPGETVIITTTVPVTFTWQWLDETLPAPGNYRLQIATDAQFLNVITDTQVTTTTHPVFGLGGLYYWRVGHSTPTNWAQIRQLHVPNIAPVAVNDSAFADTGYSVIIHVLNNDYDPDGDSLSIISVTQPPPGGGSVTLNPNDTVTYYAPTKSLGGGTLIVNFTYTISDGRGETAMATVVVTVQDPGCICPPDW